MNINHYRNEVLAHVDRAIGVLTAEICVRAKTPNSKALIEKRAARKAIEELKAKIAYVPIVTDNLEAADDDTKAIAERFAPNSR